MPQLGEKSGYNKKLLENATYGLAAIEALVDDLEVRLTALRASYLDNLSDGKPPLITDYTAARAAKLDKILENIPYTTKEIKVYPLLNYMVLGYSTDKAWAFGPWYEVVPANTITSDFLITAILVQLDNYDIDFHFFVQIGVGAVDAEVSKATVWGYHDAMSVAGRMLTGRPFPLPIPVKVAANSRVAIRFGDNWASALPYYGGIQYIELPL